MRKLYVILAFALLSLQAYAQVGNNDIALSVSLLNQDPDPAQPGEYVDLRFSVENDGAVAARNVKVELLERAPFTLDSGEQAEKPLNTIGALQKDTQAASVKYRVRVSRDAFEGDNLVAVRVSYLNSQGRVIQFTNEFAVNIRTLDATLAIESINTHPGMLEPGKTGELDIKVKNLADSSIRQVSVKLDLLLTSLAGTASASAATSTTGQSLLDLLPVASIGSGTEKKIPRLGPGEEATFTYNLAVYPDASAGVYKLPVIITFFDQNGTEIISNELAGLVIGSKPELDVVLDSYDTVNPGSTGEVTLKFINKGVSDIKFVTATLGADEDHKVLSVDSDYVGNIESDDFQTSDFRIYVEPTASERISLPVHVTYKDANNNDYAMDVTLYATMYTKEQAKQLGIEQQSSSWGTVILILVVLVALFFAWRWFKGRKK